VETAASCLYLTPYALCLISRKRWDQLAKFLKPDKLSTSSADDQTLADAAAQAEAPPVLQVLQTHVCLIPYALCLISGGGSAGVAGVAGARVLKKENNSMLMYADVC